VKKINNLRIALPTALVIASVAYLGLSLTGLLLAPSPVGASTAPSGSFSQIHLGEGDYVWNWDFNGRFLDFEAVDWGMRFIFYDNADVDKVKDRLDGVALDPRITPMLEWSGGPQYGGMLDYVEDQATQFDGDRGIKDDPGCRWNNGHMRIYATSGGDRNYNPTFGFYVVATVHKDHEDLFFCDDQYISGESHENWWVDRIEDNLGIDTQYDWTIDSQGFNWANSVVGYPEISPGDDADHWYQSDGWGVKVRIPDHG
jgi:hypothetical protein